MQIGKHFFYNRRDVLYASVARIDYYRSTFYSLVIRIRRFYLANLFWMYLRSLAKLLRFSVYDRVIFIDSAHQMFRTLNCCPSSGFTSSTIRTRGVESASPMTWSSEVSETVEMNHSCKITRLSAENLICFVGKAYGWLVANWRIGWVRFTIHRLICAFSTHVEKYITV